MGCQWTTAASPPLRPNMIFLLTATTRFSVSVLLLLPKTWENFSRVLSYPRGGARYCVVFSFFRDRDGMVEELRDMSGCRTGMPLKFAVSAGLASITACLLPLFFCVRLLCVPVRFTRSW